MGECPDWYELVRAAKYLGVAPWDLLERPVIWQRWATMAETAEAKAEKQRSESAERRAKARR